MEISTRYDLSPRAHGLRPTAVSPVSDTRTCLHEVYKGICLFSGVDERFTPQGREVQQDLWKEAANCARTLNEENVNIGTTPHSYSMKMPYGLAGRFR